MVEVLEQGIGLWSAWGSGRGEIALGVVDIRSKIWSIVVSDLWAGNVLNFGLASGGGVHGVGTAIGGGGTAIFSGFVIVI